MIAREFAQQYLSYFSSDFLFGDKGLPMRYFIPNTGAWYYSYLMLVVIIISLGLSHNKYLIDQQNRYFQSKHAKQAIIYILYLLLIAPIAAALTIDDTPNLHRSALMPLMLSISAGYLPIIWQAIPHRKWQIILLTLWAALLSFEAVDFFNKYSVHSAKFQQVYRSPAIKNLSFYLQEKAPQVATVFVEKKGEAAIFYLFYNQIYDQELSQQFQTKLQIPQVKNIYFTSLGCISPAKVIEQLQPGKNIFIMSSACATDFPLIWQEYPNLLPIDEIRSAQGDVIFKVYELNIEREN